MLEVREAVVSCMPVRVLLPDEVGRSVDILVSCIFETLPIDSAGEICEIATELANTLKAIIATDGLERQRRLLHTHIRLNAARCAASQRGCEQADRCIWSRRRACCNDHHRVDRLTSRASVVECKS